MLFMDKIKALFNDAYFLGTLLLAVVFFIYKYQFLHLPYVFDELWVYGPGVREMGIEGPSLLPDALAVEYYRAHPLMFFFLGGLWSWIFGESVFSTHIFASLISIGLIVSIFFICKKIFTSKVGFFAALILSFQSIFIAQFSLVLPEVLVTVLTLWTVYFYIQKLKWGYFIVASLLVLTKESGAIVIAAIVIWNIITGFDLKSEEKFHLSKFIKSNFILSLPIIFLLVHFILLKWHFGWFLFPEHLNEFQFTWEDFSWRIRKSFNYIFVDEGRQPILIVLISIAFLFNNRLKLKYRILLLIMFFAVTKVFFRYWKTNDFIEIYIVPLVFIFNIRYIFWETTEMDNYKKKFVGFSVVFIIIYTLFSSSYFDNLRYLFYVFPFFIIISCYYLSTISFLKNSSLLLFAFISIGFSIFYISNEVDHGDVNISYSDVAVVYSKTINYLEEKNYYEYPLKVPFLFSHALTRPLTSYLNSQKTFSNVSDNRNLDNCTKCLLIFTNVEPKSPIYSTVKESSEYELMKRINERDVWSEIYIKSN